MPIQVERIGLSSSAPGDGNVSWSSTLLLRCPLDGILVDTGSIAVDIINVPSNRAVISPNMDAKLPMIVDLATMEALANMFSEAAERMRGAERARETPVRETR